MPAAQSEVALVKIENGHLSPRKRLPHRRGKVARLPKLLRDQINRMLRDGHSYHHILEKLKTIPDAATIPISKQNLSRWKFGGYLDWLAQQEWREDLHDRQADALPLLEDPTGSWFQEVSLQIAAMRIFELLQRLEASTLSANLQDLPPRPRDDRDSNERDGSSAMDYRAGYAHDLQGEAFPNQRRSLHHPRHQRDRRCYRHHVHRLDRDERHHILLCGLRDQC